MAHTRRSRRRMPHFLDQLFGGGGGGGGGGTDYLEWYKEYILDQQAKQELAAERTDEQAETQAEYRRNEIADRQGYAGLVNVGDAVQASDATLAAQMALLPADDPQRVAYDKAIRDEAADRAQATRIITGEQYEVEDKFNALTEGLDDLGVEDIQKRLDDLGKLTGEYDWYDAADVTKELNKRLKKAQDEEARRVAAAKAAEAARAAQDGGSGGGAGGGAAGSGE